MPSSAATTAPARAASPIMATDFLCICIFANDSSNCSEELCCVEILKIYTSALPVSSLYGSTATASCIERIDAV